MTGGRSEYISPLEQEVNPDKAGDTLSPQMTPEERQRALGTLEPILLFNALYERFKEAEIKFAIQNNSGAHTNSSAPIEGSPCTTESLALYRGKPYTITSARITFRDPDDEPQRHHHIDMDFIARMPGQDPISEVIVGYQPGNTGIEEVLTFNTIYLPTITTIRIVYDLEDPLQERILQIQSCPARALLICRNRNDGTLFVNLQPSSRIGGYIPHGFFVELRLDMNQFVVYPTIVRQADSTTFGTSPINYHIGRDKGNNYREERRIGLELARQAMVDIHTFLGTDPRTIGEIY